MRVSRARLKEMHDNNTKNKARFLADYVVLAHLFDTESLTGVSLNFNFAYDFFTDDINNLEKIATVENCIYFLIQSRRIVYIGRTVDVKRRIKEHIKEGKKTFDAIGVITMRNNFLKLLGEEEALSFYETAFIAQYRPLYNITDNNCDLEVNPKLINAICFA